MDYQAFIDAVQADPDFPVGVVATALHGKGRVNFKHEKTLDIDQWQMAIDIDTPIPEALAAIITQYERARDRIAAEALRQERHAETRRIQGRYREQMRALTDDQQQRVKSKHAAIQARHAKPEEKK
jgi:hypothetical protein